MRFPRPTAPEEDLEGTLERVTFSSEETGFTVLKLLVSGRREPVTVVGNLAGVQPGETLRLAGRWSRHPKHGEQFEVSRYRSVQPATVAGIEKYLGSGMVRGIGAMLAGRIVAAFGLETFDVIDHHPERLREVDGIGPVRSERVLAAWTEQKQVREVMVFLQAHGVSPLLAIRIFKRYGDRAIETVKEDPYRLALDIFGIGFLTADRIAERLGIDKASPQRAMAGILHALGELSDEGHACAPREALFGRAAELLELEPERLAAPLEELSGAGLVVREPVEGDGGELVYLASLHAAEVAVARQLRAMAKAPSVPLDVSVDAALASFEGKAGLTLAEPQRLAIREAVRRRLLVVTGGPGTGKTTLLKGLLEVLRAAHQRVLLAAPTGRAAKRMAEATGHEARTLHRLLEYSPQAHGFQRNRENPLDADALVVDEASMIDVGLAARLLEAVPPPCRLVLVGDVDQLPSVGPGHVLGDLIRSGACEVVRLAHVFRQAEQSAIVTTAHRLLRGLAPGPSGRDVPLTDFYFIEKDEPEGVLDAVKRLVRERIPRAFKVDPVGGIQVLTPMHKGTLGAAALNAELQLLLNPAGASVARGSRSFRVGDKVMQLRNNYELDVYNGDIGRVSALDVEEHALVVRFDDRDVRYELADLDELTLAYAATIHKAQGSEYPCVVLVVHTQHWVMLARNLLYTGITRGRRLVVVVGSARAVQQAVRNSRPARRWTRLAERLASG